MAETKELQVVDIVLVAYVLTRFGQDIPSSEDRKEATIIEFSDDRSMVKILVNEDREYLSPKTAWLRADGVQFLKRPVPKPPVPKKVGWFRRFLEAK